MLKNIAKQPWVRHWLPQGLRDFLNRIFGYSIIYQGRFKTWGQAINHAKGYDDHALFERIASAAEKVKKGEAVWEKDGVVYDYVPHNFRLWACLSRVALDNQGRLTVLDFGGAFGSSFYQCKDFFSDIDLRWCIVEQEHVAERGRKSFSTDQLHFYSSLESCLRQEQPHVLLLSAALQYIEFPYDLLLKMVETNIRYLLIDRHPCSSGREIITTQILPAKNLYPGSYACRLFSHAEMIEWLKKYYEILIEYDAGDVDPPIYGSGFYSTHCGYFLRTLHK